MINVKMLVVTHDDLVWQWHQDRPLPRFNRWLNLVVIQHKTNYDLWHYEDRARAPMATDFEMATVKRLIDKVNQRRNDMIEELDRELITYLASKKLVRDDAPLNSETPGQIVDRLSILALKMYHMREETTRATASEDQRATAKGRLVVLNTQRSDLARCLTELWHEVVAGRRRFKLYRQMKMYNDPTLNPAIYNTKQ